MNRLNYLLFVIFLLVLASVLPSLYPVLIYKISTDIYFTLRMISQSSWTTGYLYTAAASVLLVALAWVFKPHFPDEASMRFHKEKFDEFKAIIFSTAVISLCISITLNFTFGASVSNLLSQRPQYAIHLGYLTRIIGYSAPLYFLAQMFFYGKLGEGGLVLLLLFLLQSISSMSRSGLLIVCFTILIGLAYSPAVKIRLKMFILILFLGVPAAYIAGLLRGGGDLLRPHVSLLLRFFANNQALFLAVENQEKIRDILLYNQPTVMFQQMFSFIMERTEYPSSFRLLEYWGDHITALGSEHIAGYAYGWLGLTYALLGWHGLWAVAGVLSFYFFALRWAFHKPAFARLAFSAYIADMFLEFFMNLGMDSYAEKIFKGLLAIFGYILLISFLKFFLGTPVVGRSSSQTVPLDREVVP